MENKKKTQEQDLKSCSKAELQEIVKENAEGLSKQHGCVVEALLLNDAGFNKEDGEWVIGYYKTPTLYQKMTIIDNVDKDKTMKGFNLLKANLLKENSSPRLVNFEDPKNHGVILGASLALAGAAFDFSINQVEAIKKNGE